MLSVGSLLQKERQKKGISLRQVEKDIRVREKFIQAIEANNWNYFSSKIYIVGIIKVYAKYLGLDQQKMIAFFRRDYERKDDLHFQKPVASANFLPETKKMVYAGIAAVFLVCLAYFIYQLYLFLSPPKVILMSPAQSVFRSVERIIIKGKVDKDASVSIFGDRVFQNKDGIFEYDLPLKKGVNSVTIEVVGANGKKTIVKKDYLLE